jgi:hypothetical protein
VFQFSDTTWRLAVWALEGFATGFAPAQLIAQIEVQLADPRVRNMAAMVVVSRALHAAAGAAVPQRQGNE